MNDATTYDLIERYLNDALSADERSAVEARLKNDAEFYEQVAAHLAANEIIIDNALLDVKKELQKIHAENSAKPKSNSRKFYYGGALVLTGIIAAAVLMLQNNAPTNLAETKAPKGSLKEKASTTEFETNNNEPVKEEKIVKENKNATVKNSVKEKALPLETILAKSNAAPSTVSEKPMNEQIRSTENKTTPKNSSPDSSKTVVGKIALSKEVTPETSPCNEVVMEPKFSVTNSCENQKNGAILFDYEPTDGVYEFSIDGGKTFYSNAKFSNLGVANYSLIIKDRQNCKSKLVETRIEKENCNSIIYPQQQKYWEVPLERFEGQQVLLKIMNGRTGEIVYQKRLPIANSYTWSGSDDNNNPLPMGIYVYELSSGEPSQTVTGQITIVQ